MDPNTKFTLGWEGIKLIPVTKQEMIKASDEYFKDNKKDKNFTKGKIPLTEFQKKQLSNFCQNLRYRIKSSPEKKDYGSYRAEVPHLVAQEEGDDVIKEIFDIIEKNTYPYDGTILTSWCSWYGEGSFLGLHQDPFADKNGKHIFNNSVLAHQSEDLEGGELIVGGDVPDGTSDAMGYMVNVKTRLKVMKHDGIGSIAYWKANAVHGVSDILRGERITLMVLKSSK